MVLDQLQPADKAVVEALAQHRAVEHVFRRVADLRLLDGARELLEELVVDGLVHDHGAERGAALAGGAEPGEKGALDREIQVSVRHDDERVLAAELQARGLHVPAAELAYLLPLPPRSP